jgi:hypothetical protein
VGLVIEALAVSLASSELRCRCHLYPTPHALPRLFAMSVAGAEAGASDGANDVYEALEGYNWDDDVEFQAGLSAILGSNSSPEQAAELALRARCFYYARYVGFRAPGRMYADLA